MQIAVCDDEKSILTSLCEKIEEYAIKKDYDVHCLGFSTASDLLKSEEHFDLYLLDYQLKNQDLDGIGLAEILRKRNANAEIAFATSFHEIVYDQKLLTEIGIMGFLRKPVKQDELEYIVDHLYDTSINSSRILLKRDGIIETITIRDIIYIEAYQRGTKLYLQNDSREYSYSLFSIAEKLPKELFVQSHRSFFVNMEYIKKYDAKDIFLYDGSIVPISKNFLKNFRKAYESYIFGKTVSD